MCLEGSVTEILREAGPEVGIRRYSHCIPRFICHTGIARRQYRC
jgi:hypothetical protein